MGVFDEYNKEKHDEAYQKGVEDSRNASQWQHGAKDVADVVTEGLKDSVGKSYDKGWEDQRTGKVK